MSTRRSRRRSGAASVSDGPSGSEGPNERSATTSPIRRRSRQGASPRSLDSSQKELALRLLGQFSDIRSVFNQQRQENGEDTNGPDVLIEGAKCGDAKSDGEELMDLIDTATNADSNTVGDTQAAQSSAVSCDASKLLHIEVKVEDVAPDSLSITTYSEQQPSTSSAMTVSQSGVSLSRATPTPRSSIITGHESNVERAAKQEAQVLARVAELRRQGLWTTSRLPMIEMPARNKTHWDYLLEEMRWMAADFRQERTFKRHAAKKFATQIARIRKDKEQEEERSEQRAVKEAKRVCAMIAKMVRDFWLNVDKVVDFRAQEIIESMKRKALDQQLELMVGQADKLSEMVQEGLTEKASKAPSLAGDEDDDKDEDFAGMESESDDERTIAKAEAVMGTDVKEEVQQLEKEQNLELDDFLASLPAGYLESMGMGKASTSKVTEESINEPSEGEASEESSDDEEQNEDNDTSKEEVDSASGEPPTKKKKPIDKVIEESSPVQSTDSMGRSVSSASVKESEMSTMPPSEEVSKDVPQGINFDLLNSENSEDRQNELANIAEEALKLQPKGFTLETTQVKTDVPPLIRGTLREYQLVGLDWLVTLYDKGLNGILADEMGLGKTIQTIALLAHLACKEAVWGPHLIVVPTSVILNWEMELKKWCPAFKILTYFGSQKERAEKRKGWSKPNMFHVCITSYKLVTQDIRIFKHKAWQYFILDEAQNIKNFKSQRWQALLNVRARRRLLLTGTPLQNSLMELWSLMHFLMPAIFASHNDFKDWFSNPLTDMMEGSAEWNAPLVQRLHKVLRPFILRRLKKEVEKQLPEKIEHVVKCSLSKRQRYLYDDFISQRTTRENLRSGSVFSVLNIVMQLRKCCNHPNLFEPRPVVSPFVMHPRTLTVPAMLVDICNSGTASGSRLRIPECLRLDHVMRGSHFAISETRLLSAKKPLIEEIGQHDAGPPMPKVDGFKFVRPPPPLRRPKHAELESMQASGNASAVSVPAGSVPQSGEYYVCVDNGTARVYQLVTSSCGERTIRECDPSMVAGSAGGSTPMVTTLEHPPAISLEVDPLTHKPVTNTQHMEVDMKSTVKTEMVEVIETPNDNTPLTAAELYKKAIERRAAFRTTTVLNKTTVRAGQTLKQEQVSVSNGCPTLSDGRQAIPAGTTIPYQSMGSPSRARCVAQVRPLTAAGLPLHRTITNGVASQGTLPSAPPKKRRKNVAPKIDRQPYAELILSETRSAQRERREACAQRIAQVCAQRTDWPNMRRAPLVSDELLSILINELKHKHRRKPKGPNSENVKCGPIELNGFECWEKLGWTHHKLRSWTEDMVERFTVYVHSALADAPRMSISSNGLSAYERQTTHNQVEHCRRLFQADDPLVSKCRTAQMVQFPELRLIEYDCGKLQVLSALLREMFLYKHRCLIFTQMSRMLDVLQAFLSFHGYQYFRLDGTTGIEQRQAMMERFNRDPKIFCFILSTRSGGVGVNLTGADTVIFYDSDWNPTMDAQAQDRCHRIGQTRNVNIYRLISERTIEENILKKAMQKRRLGELAIDEGGFTPEFFQEDNIKDLFEDEAAVADVIAPLTVSDAAEVEKAMATVEDQQDVAAAKRAKAEARAELAEFDENVQLRDNAEGQNSNDRADSKYFELISQLKPIERYAVNFLEVENKPDFEEEVKEAEAMIASKKDEWLKAHETVMEGGEEEEETDSEFDLTYANGFGVAGSVDEVRTNKRLKGHNATTHANAKQQPSPKTRALPIRVSTRVVQPRRQLSSPQKVSPRQSSLRRLVTTTPAASSTVSVGSASSSAGGKKARGRPKKEKEVDSGRDSSDCDTPRASKRTSLDSGRGQRAGSSSVESKSSRRAKGLSLHQKGNVLVVDSDEDSDTRSLASIRASGHVTKGEPRVRKRNPMLSSSSRLVQQQLTPSPGGSRLMSNPSSHSPPLVMMPLSQSRPHPPVRSLPSSRHVAMSSGMKGASASPRGNAAHYSSGSEQRYITSASCTSQRPSTSAGGGATYMYAPSSAQPSTSRMYQRDSHSGGYVPVQRRVVVMPRRGTPSVGYGRAQAQPTSQMPITVFTTTGGGTTTYRVVNTVRSLGGSGQTLNQTPQSSYVLAGGRRSVAGGPGYTKPSLGDYERPRLFFRKRTPIPSLSDEAASSSTAAEPNEPPADDPTGLPTS